MKKDIYNFTDQKGEIPKMFIIVAGVILVIVAAIIIIVIIGGNGAKSDQDTKPSGVQEPVQLVYQKQIGDIDFTLQSSTDLGNVLKAPNSYQKDVTTTERFIQVVVGAQNKGKTATNSYGWDLGNIIDSDGRIFANVNNVASYYLPNPNPCGLSLKPEFYPVNCTKVYEVAKISKGLKIEITVKDQPTGFLDLNLN